MPVDINGYVLSNASGLKLGASNTKIAAADYGVRVPWLPSMYGAATGGGAYKAYPFRVNSVLWSLGWNVITYRYTAPVAGIYYTSYSGIVGDGTATQTAGYYALIINGANTYFGYKDTISVWELMHIEGMFKLEAGDTIEWAMNLAPGPASAYPGGAYHSNHNACTIWLVG